MSISRNYVGSKYKWMTFQKESWDIKYNSLTTMNMTAFLTLNKQRGQKCPTLRKSLSSKRGNTVPEWVFKLNSPLATAKTQDLNATCQKLRKFTNNWCQESRPLGDVNSISYLAPQSCININTIMRCSTVSPQQATLFNADTEDSYLLTETWWRLTTKNLMFWTYKCRAVMVLMSTAPGHLASGLKIKPWLNNAMQEC